MSVPIAVVYMAMTD